MNEPERLLNARQVADALGLSTGTILDRFERGDLPGFRLYGGRVGAPVRFRWSEIEAWLEEGRCGPRIEGSTRTPERLAATALHSDRVEA